MAISKQVSPDVSSFDAKNPNTGGPPLTRKSLIRFPLSQFLAYVHVRGGISVREHSQTTST